MPPKYSIIIPTYNSRRTLEALLESLTRQSLDDFETIVIDDCSTDDTAEAVARFDVHYERLETNSGPAVARNRGAEIAQGTWLIFADADTEFMPETVAKIDATLNSSDAVALVGSYTGISANEGFAPRYKALWEYATVDLVVKTNAQGLLSIQMWAPRPGVVRKDALLAVGGFDARFRGADVEDIEFGYRLHQAGYAIYFAPAIRIRHHYPATVTKELKAFARRTVLWMRMMRSRQRFDAVGEGSGGLAFAHLVGFGAFWLFWAGLLFPPLLWGFAAGVVLYGLFIRRFLALALRQEGIFFTLKAYLYCWAHTVTLGFSAAYGLLTRSPGG